MNTWLAFARVGARCANGAAIAAALVCAAAPAMAGELDYQTSLGLGYSDNVGRHPDGEEDDTSIAQAGLRFSYDEHSKRLHADVTGDVAYLTYLSGDYDDELLGNVFADTALAIIPERLIWTLTDQWGQIPADPFQPATPENRENINYFSTGPDFVIGMGSQFRLRLGAFYSLVDYEDDPFDSSSTGGKVSLARVISDRSSISLNANTREVEYDEVSLNANFGQTEGFLRYEAAGARTNIGIDLGYSELDRDALPEPESGALVRMDVSRRMSSSSVLSLAGGREFTTAAGAFAIDQGAGIGAAPSRQTADPFTQDRVLLTWNFNRNVTALSVSTAWSKRSYEDRPDLDETLATLTTRYRRDLSPVMSFEASAAFSTIDYQPPSDDFDDLTVGLGFQWRLSRSLTLDAKYQYATRNSVVPSSEYTENRLLVTIGFGRGDPRAGRNLPTFGVDPAPAAN